MGEDKHQDPITSKSGKIGYAWDYFDGLVDKLGRFLDTMEKVRYRREELKPELRLYGLSRKARHYLDSVSGTKFFWLWENPRIKGAEDSYLQAQCLYMEINIHLHLVKK